MRKERTLSEKEEEFFGKPKEINYEMKRLLSLFASNPQKNLNSIVSKKISFSEIERLLEAAIASMLIENLSQKKTIKVLTTTVNDLSQVNLL